MVVIVQFVGHVPTVYGIPTAGNGLWIVASGISTVGSLPTVVRWKTGCGLDWKSALKALASGQSCSTWHVPSQKSTLRGGTYSSAQVSPRGRLSSLNSAPCIQLPYLDTWFVGKTFRSIIISFWFGVRMVPLHWDYDFLILLNFHLLDVIPILVSDEVLWFQWESRFRPSARLTLGVLLCQNMLWVVAIQASRQCALTADAKYYTSPAVAPSCLLAGAARAYGLLLQGWRRAQPPENHDVALLFAALTVDRSRHLLQFLLRLVIWKWTLVTRPFFCLPFRELGKGRI